MTRKLYIANDVEASGHMLGHDAPLSWGACVVPQDSLSKDELIRQGLVFYTELKPTSFNFDIEAMRVGCVGLRCIEGLDHPKYDVTSPEFSPAAVLDVLAERGETLTNAVRRFKEWAVPLSNHAHGYYPIEGVVDTTFFDSGWINYIFGMARERSLYGHRGLDLASVFRGYERNLDARLKSLGMVDDREVAHCSEDDAIFLAGQAREVLFKRMLA
jgi:hypothetical protein